MIIQLRKAARLSVGVREMPRVRISDFRAAAAYLTATEARAT